MGNQQPNGKKDDKDKEKKKYEAPIPTRVGKKKRVKVNCVPGPLVILIDKSRGQTWLTSCQKSSLTQSADFDF